MNRNRYRLVFDKRTGTLIPVAEFTTSAKKGSGSTSAQGDGVGETSTPRWRRLAAMMALGMSVPLTVGAQNVVIDPSSGATLSQTANGVPLYNIVDPNGTGLSHNKALEFNVGPEGLVFNNSLHDGISRIGGLAMKNPHLTREAGGILVEVTGAHRSDLLGTMEVYGGKADLLIANENGLHVNGVSLINVDRATLTTGRYAGEGRQFEIHGGAIDVAGAGLSTEGLTHADLVARSMRLHGVVAGSDSAELQLVAGLNNFDATTGAATERADAFAPATPVEFAIDASAVSMYGKRIKMISTESGLGVRHEGVVSAVGDIEISVDGDLRVRAFQSGGDVVIAAEDVSLGANDGGRGLSSMVHGDVSVDARGDLQLSGNHEAGNFRFDADGVLTSNGTVQAPNRTPDIGGSIDVRAGSVVLTGGADWQASDEARILAGTMLLANGARLRATDIALAASGTLDNAGVVVGNRSLRLDADLLVNSGELASTHVGIAANRLLNSGIAQGVAAIDIALGAGESSNIGVLTAGDALTIRGLHATLANRGELSAAGLLAVDAQALANHAGAIVWANGVAMRLERLENAGTVYAGTLDITADWLRNVGANAYLYAVDTARLDVAGDIENTEGATISSENALTIDADGNLRNSDGAKIGAAVLVAHVGGDLDNTRDADINALATHLDVDGTVRNDARIVGSQTLALDADTLDNAGLVYGYDARVATQGALDNRAGGRLEAYDTLVTEVGGTLTNAGIITGYDIDASVARDLVNHDGGRIQADRFLDATVGGNLSNRGANSALLGAVVDVAVAGNAENVDGALLQATYALSLEASNLANRNAKLMAGTVDASGRPVYGDVSLTTTAGDFVNDGQVVATGNVWIDADGNVRNNAKAQIAGDNVMIAATGDLANAATAAIDALGLAQVDIDGTLANDGRIAADGVFIEADAAIRNTGRIVGGTWIEADTTALQNTATGTIEAKDDVLLSTETFANTGKIHSDGFTTLTIENGLDLTINDSARGPTANGVLTLNADDVRIDRELVNRGHIVINADGSIVNAAGIITGESLYATAGASATRTGDFTNHSLVWAAGDVNISADGLTNKAGAEIEATRDMALDIDGTLVNEAGARIAAGGNAWIDAQLVQNRVDTTGGLTVTHEERGNSSYTRNVNLVRKDKYEVFFGQTWDNDKDEFVSTGAGLAVLGSNLTVTAQGVIEAGGNLSFNQGNKKDKGATVENQGRIVSGANMFINGNVLNAGVAETENLRDWLNRPLYVELKVTSNILSAKESLSFTSFYAMLDHVYSSNKERSFGPEMSWFTAEVHKVLATYQNPSFSAAMSHIFGAAWRSATFDDMSAKWNAGKGQLSSKDGFTALADRGPEIMAGGSIVQDEASGSFMNTAGARRLQDASVTVGIGDEQVDTIGGHFDVLKNLGDLLQAIDPRESLDALTDSKKFRPAETRPSEAPIDWSQIPPPTGPVSPGAPPVPVAPLYESRIEFVDQGLYYGSQYFFEQIGFLSDRTVTVVGDNYFINELVLKQVQSSVGGFLAAKHEANGTALVKVLMDAAGVEGPRLGLQVGLAPTPEQLAQLDKDIVWLVAMEVDGVVALVPQVFLSAQTVEAAQADRAAGGATVAAGGSLIIDANEGGVTNHNGTMRAKKDLVILSKGDVDNIADNGVEGGGLQAGGTLYIEAKGELVPMTMEEVLERGVGEKVVEVPMTQAEVEALVAGRTEDVVVRVDEETGIFYLNDEAQMKVESVPKTVRVDEETGIVYVDDEPQMRGTANVNNIGGKMQGQDVVIDTTGDFTDRVRTGYAEDGSLVIKQRSQIRGGGADPDAPEAQRVAEESAKDGGKRDAMEADVAVATHAIATQAVRADRDLDLAGATLSVTGDKTALAPVVESASIETQPAATETTTSEAAPKASGGSVTIMAKGNIDMTASDVKAEAVKLISTDGNVSIKGVHEVSSSFEKETQNGFLTSKSMTTTRADAKEVGSTVRGAAEGGSLVILAEKGDVVLQGGEFGADQGLIKAGGSVITKTARDYSYEKVEIVAEGLQFGARAGALGSGAAVEYNALDGFSAAVETGGFENGPAGGGKSNAGGLNSGKSVLGEALGGEIGYGRTELTTTHSTIKNHNAQLDFGSGVAIIAEGTVDIGGADIRAVKGEGDGEVLGNVMIQGARITSTKYEDVDHKTTERKEYFAGVTASGQSSVLDAVNNSKTLADKVAQGMEVDAAGTTLQAVADATNLAFNDTVGASANVAIKTTHTTSSDTTKSENINTVTGNISMTSTVGNIDLAGVFLDGAGGTVLLDAAKDLNVRSAQTTTSGESFTEDHQITVGASASVAPGGAGIGVSAGYNGSTSDTSYSGTSHTNAAIVGSNVLIKSGGNTSLHGANVVAGDVELDIGGNLDVKSVQDTYTSDTFNSRFGSSVGASVQTQTLVGAVGSVDFAAGTSWERMAVTAEQSGIKAESINGRVGGNLTQTGAHLVDTSGTGSLDVGGQHISNQLIDTHNSDGLMVGGGGGAGESGLATVTFTYERDDRKEFESIQENTVSGLNVNAAGGTKGSFNSDADKMETVLKDKMIAGNKASASIGIGDIRDLVGKKKNTTGDTNDLPTSAGRRPTQQSLAGDGSPDGGTSRPLADADGTVNRPAVNLDDGTHDYRGEAQALLDARQSRPARGQDAPDQTLPASRGDADLRLDTMPPALRDADGPIRYELGERLAPGVGQVVPADRVQDMGDGLVLMRDKNGQLTNRYLEKEIGPDGTERYRETGMVSKINDRPATRADLATFFDANEVSRPQSIFVDALQLGSNDGLAAVVPKPDYNGDVSPNDRNDVAMAPTLPRNDADAAPTPPRNDADAVDASAPTRQAPTPDDTVGPLVDAPADAAPQRGDDPPASDTTPRTHDAPATAPAPANGKAPKASKKAKAPSDAVAPAAKPAPAKKNAKATADTVPPQSKRATTKKASEPDTSTRYMTQVEYKKVQDAMASFNGMTNKQVADLRNKPLEFTLKTPDGDKSFTIGKPADFLALHGQQIQYDGKSAPVYLHVTERNGSFGVQYKSRPPKEAAPKPAKATSPFVEAAKLDNPNFSRFKKSALQPVADTIAKGGDASSVADAAATVPPEKWSKYPTARQALEDVLGTTSPVADASPDSPRLDRDALKDFENFSRQVSEDLQVATKFGMSPDDVMVEQYAVQRLESIRDGDGDSGSLASALSAEAFIGLGLYTNGEYRPLNKALREGKLTAEQQTLADSISGGLRDAPSNLRYEGDTYRGLKLSPAEFERMMSTGALHEPGFMSTSTDLAAASIFATRRSGTDDRVPVVLEVKGNGQGVDLSGLSFEGHEAEVLFDRGSLFRVVESTAPESAGGAHRVVVEFVGPVDIRGDAPQPVVPSRDRPYDTIPADVESRGSRDDDSGHDSDDDSGYHTDDGSRHESPDPTRRNSEDSEVFDDIDEDQIDLSMPSSVPEPRTLTPKEQANAFVEAAKRDNATFSRFKDSSLEPVAAALRKGEDFSRVLEAASAVPPAKWQAYPAAKNALFNLAPDAEVAKIGKLGADASNKQGYNYVPIVGDDSALVVAHEAAHRILAGKAPYPAVLGSAEDLAAFRAGLADVRADVALRWKDADNLHPSDKRLLIGLHEATEPGTMPLLNDASSGLLKSLGPDEKLYVNEHGTAGADYVFSKRGDTIERLGTQDLARDLADRGLPSDFRDLRLFTCEGACPAEDGGPSTGQRLADAMGREGFTDVEVSAFDGMLYGAAYLQGDGEFHHGVLKADEMVRGSDARKTFRYDPANAQEASASAPSQSQSRPLPPIPGDAQNAPRPDILEMTSLGLPQPGGAHKSSHIWVPAVGDQTAVELLRHAGSRIRQGKEPRAMIFTSADDLATFNADVSARRAQLERDIPLMEQRGEQGVVLDRMKGEYAATAPGRLTAFNSMQLGKVKPGDKLYVQGHGDVAGNGLMYEKGGANASITNPELARMLKNAGLDPAFTDIRMMMCGGACRPDPGEPSNAEKFAHALGKAGFEDVTVSAFPLPLTQGAMKFGDGLHFAVQTPGGAYARASSARKTFSYDPDLEIPRPRMPKLAPEEQARQFIEAARYDNKTFSRFRKSALDPLAKAIRRGDSTDRLVEIARAIPTEKWDQYPAAWVAFTGMLERNEEWRRYEEATAP